MLLFRSNCVTQRSLIVSLCQADELFRKEAEDATRTNPEWTYSKEQASMKAALLEIATRSRKVVEAKVQANKQNQQAMQYLQKQQQQLQAIQQQISVRTRRCVWYASMVLLHAYVRLCL
jgi:hypothetical protein